ncbi:hypothetical protein ABZ541_29720 [Micromonospora sediminicola]
MTGAHDTTEEQQPCDDDPEAVDPWFGIPVELLDSDRPYDLDTAGGCG